MLSLQVSGSKQPGRMQVAGSGSGEDGMVEEHDGAARAHQAGAQCTTTIGAANAMPWRAAGPLMPVDTAAAPPRGSAHERHGTIVRDTRWPVNATSPVPCWTLNLD